MTTQVGDGKNRRKIYDACRIARLAAIRKKTNYRRSTLSETDLLHTFGTGCCGAIKVIARQRAEKPIEVSHCGAQGTLWLSIADEWTFHQSLNHQSTAWQRAMLGIYRGGERVRQTVLIMFHFRTVKYTIFFANGKHCETRQCAIRKEYRVWPWNRLLQFTRKENGKSSTAVPPAATTVAQWKPEQKVQRRTFFRIDFKIDVLANSMRKFYFYMLPHTFPVSLLVREGREHK